MSVTHRSGTADRTETGGVELRELEAFLVLAEERHFGRTGERLYVSQSRISQLLRALERRVGARLVERTSRRVRLTPLGEALAAELRPAYAALRAGLASARAAARGVGGAVRVGFQGTAGDGLVRALALFEERHPGSTATLSEVPLCDPFGAVRAGEVDAAVVLLPVREPDLVLGPVFSRRPQTLALPAGHPLASTATATGTATGKPVGAEALAGLPLIGVRGPAPDYWRRAAAPDRTPAGAPVPAGPEAGTLQEGLTLVAAGRGGMLLCRPTAEMNARRALAFVPVDGLPESALGLVWRADRETERVRAFARAVADAEG
ncbi:LysR family transcriptional regulator [Streptomyces sp. NPDC047097]|uniref:LysR family transcriptional regulator n=1 Tax=Streptomyces sp. NPDC047097 TaxID=3155260 RepID=UPI0033DB7FA6